MLLKLTGTMPLILNNVATADPMHPVAKQMKAITDKKKNKTDADDAELSKLKWYAALYLDGSGIVVLPAPNVFRSLIEAATVTRDGKRIERGVSFLTDRSPLAYPGPRDLDELWKGGTSEYVDRRMVNKSGRRVPAVRPIFPIWSASYEIEVDPEIINDDAFEAIAQRAGKSIGVGDFRRFYGKFKAEVTA